MPIQETADELSGLFMQGGAVEGTPEHQHILAIMSKSVRNALLSLLKPSKLSCTQSSILVLARTAEFLMRREFLLRSAGLTSCSAVSKTTLLHTCVTHLPGSRERLKACLFGDTAAEQRAACAQREVQEVLLRMFPYKAARLKSDIQRAACTQVGMHTPAHWARVTVGVPSAIEPLGVVEGGLLFPLRQLPYRKCVITSGWAAAVLWPWPP